MILIRDYLERITACIVVIVAFPVIWLIDMVLGKDSRHDD